MPRPLLGSEHVRDAALLPIQMITAPYTEASLTEAIRSKFMISYAEHLYQSLLSVMLGAIMGLEEVTLTRKVEAQPRRQGVDNAKQPYQC